MTTVQFVSSIAASPTVRLALNTGPWTLHAPRTDLSPPDLRMARVSTLLTDGENIPASAYANRILRLGLTLSTASTDLAATQLQALFRELNRPTNILKWHPAGATAPVFFRTFRASSEAVRVVRGHQLHEIDVDIEAEPFAVGLLETLSPSTVTNNPATSCYFDIAGSAIKGDVETPLILTIPYADVSGFGPSAFAVRRTGTPSATPLFLQAESATLGTGATLPGNDVLMSGSGSNYARITFTTATMVDRLLFGVHPASASVDARDRYRVLVRYRKNTSTDVINMRLKVHTGGTAYTNTTVACAASTTNIRYADLGTVQIPVGTDPVYDGFSGSERAARGAVVTLMAERTSGAGTLDVDVLVWMPCDSYGEITWPPTS
ncbi:MAG TPA: hypothetical protein VFR23_22510, partial [Jiangellaceae bacterium]|nr:hypothetical protein [Jiangellaceae bacterium]